jgi:hypothetical protein
LEEYAYPVIREVTRFYLGMVEEREDGRYTFVGTQPYEGSIFLRESLTDLAHARALFRVFLEASTLVQADDVLQERVRHVLAHLADYVVRSVATHHWVDPDSVMDMRPIRFAEVKPGDPTMPIWFLGYKAPGRQPEIPDGTPVHEGMTDPAQHLWMFSSSNMAPIFPTGLVGLDQQACNTVNAFGYDHQGFSLWMVAKARLGLGTELQESLAHWPHRFQLFPQGFGHWALPDHPDMEEDPRFLKQISVVDSGGETIHWPTAGVSLHFSIEAIPMLQLAINEMLLQSYSGTLRVFPAVSPAWTGRFRLHAAGRFIVSAGRTAEGVTFVTIESRGGRPCRISNPWPTQPVTLYRQAQGWVQCQLIDGDTLTFATEPGEIYLLLPETVAPQTLSSAFVTGSPNRDVKWSGKARLGMPKGF